MTLEMNGSNLTDGAMTAITTVNDPQWQIILESIVLIVLICLGLAGNFLIMVAIMKDMALKNQTGNMFIINLAFIDLLVNTMILPIILANVITRKNILDDPTVCSIASYFMVFCCGSSIYSLVWIAFSRYMHICHNNRYKHLFTKYNTGLMVLSIWLWSGICSMTPVFGFGNYLYDEAEKMCAFKRTNIGHTLFLIAIGILLPSLFIFVLYGKIFLHIRAITQDMRQHGLVSQGTNKKQRATMTLFIVFLLFMIFWSPFGLVSLADHTDTWPPQIHRYTAWLGLSNSTINSFVYGLRSKQFRVAYKKVLCFWKKNHVHPDTDNTTQRQTYTIFSIAHHGHKQNPRVFKNTIHPLDGIGQTSTVSNI